MKNSDLKLNITWLYPKEMSTYGDTGNIVTLLKRCQWRGIETKLNKVGVGDKLPEDTDFYFFGGGQDVSQTLVAQDLKSKRSELQAEAEGNKVFLGICGGYQLFGLYYRDSSGVDMEGVNILDIATRAGSKRMMGNIVIEADILKDKIVGFENHSGKTKIGQKAKPLGKVLVGHGNNGDDKTEGAVQNNVYGCYLHGPLLPKNPSFVDYLIKLSLRKKFGEIELKFLNDSVETSAHEVALQRAYKTH